MLNIREIHPSFNPLGKVYKLRGRYFNWCANTISLRRGGYPFSLLMSALSLGIVSF